MVGAAEPAHVLDDGVLVADLDVAVAAGAVVALAGDAADQPGLVALFGQPAQAPAHARQAVELGHAQRPPCRAIQAKPAAIARFEALASRSAALAPGRLTAGEADQSASVAISVPRSQASDCQSAALPRRVGDQVGGGEGEPDRAAAPEQVLGVGRGLVVAEQPQRRRRRRDRGAARAAGRRRSCCGW